MTAALEQSPQLLGQVPVALLFGDADSERDQQEAAADRFVDCPD